MGAIKTITTSTKPQRESMNVVALELKEAIGRRLIQNPKQTKRQRRKLNPRPVDFNEDAIRRLPTFRRWEKLAEGEKLQCVSEYTKGRDNDEELLLRRLFSRRMSRNRRKKKMGSR